MRKRTTTIDSHFGIDTAPDKKLIRIDADKAVLHLDVLAIEPATGTVELAIVEAINPVFAATYSRDSDNKSIWTAGRIVRGDQSFARAMIVADDTNNNALSLVNVSGRFVSGETIREVGIKTTDTPNVAAFATLESLPVIAYSEGDTAGTIAATSADASVVLDDLPGGELTATFYFLKSTFGGSVTSASYVVRLVS